MVTISLNSLLFRGIRPLEQWLRRRPGLWTLLTRRSESSVRRIAHPLLVPDDSPRRPRAIIVGYGPVGQTASAILKDFGVARVIVDLNIDTINRLADAGETAVYGDAAHRDILVTAGIASAEYLLVTTPDPHTRTVIVIAARELNPDVKVFVRARYLGERAWLEEIGATEVCFEEAEAAIGLATFLLREMGSDEDRLRFELRRTRTRLAFYALPGDSIAITPLSTPVIAHAIGLMEEAVDSDAHHSLRGAPADYLQAADYLPCLDPKRIVMAVPLPSGEPRQKLRKLFSSGRQAGNLPEPLFLNWKPSHASPPSSYQAFCPSAGSSRTTQHALGCPVATGRTRRRPAAGSGGKQRREGDD